MQLKLTAIAASVLIANHCLADSKLIISEIPQVVLANEYKQGIDVSDYWRSEKLDGVRAIWDGKDLLTRKGRKIFAPHWFIESLPEFAVEGELWAGRGKFSLVQQTVLDHTPSDSAWRNIDFMLFDLPQSAGDYVKRYANLVYLVTRLNQPHIKYIEHKAIGSEQELMAFLDHLDESQGEGVMLRKVSSRYQAGRSSDLLKLKRYLDDEATVIGYRVGEGKYKGMLGSLLVQWKDGRQFYIGTGFTDLQRREPPPVGAVITFRYNGLTSGDLPRFARFLRVRLE